LNLGLVAELSQREETFFSDLKILLRRDSAGFYAMSTACTYDLSPLIFSERDGKLLWRSQYTESAYNPDGSVAHGPTKYPLPYYKLQVASGTIGGPPDTIFVEVGVERPSSWRLSVP
jgi:Rieske Fe-S protein